MDHWTHFQAFETLSSAASSMFHDTFAPESLDRVDLPSTIDLLQTHHQRSLSGYIHKWCKTLFDTDLENSTQEMKALYLSQTSSHAGSWLLASCANAAHSVTNLQFRLLVRLRLLISTFLSAPSAAPINLPAIMSANTYYAHAFAMML
jgi:hypothetical protein